MRYKPMEARRDELIDALCIPVKEHFGVRAPLLILYGSSVARSVTSDFDVCMILSAPSPSDRTEMERIVRRFHIQNGIPLDEEVPFEKKLIYSQTDVDTMIRNPPFQRELGGYRFSPIIKSADFLASEPMRLRLFLNVLTTKHRLLMGAPQLLEEFRARAWGLLVWLVYHHEENRPLDARELVASLCRNSRGGQEGKCFLGYNSDDVIQCAHLLEMAERTLETLLATGHVRRDHTGCYRAAEPWLTA